MPVPSNISELSTSPGSNYPAGSESPATIDDYLRSHAAFIAQQRDLVRPVALGGTGATTAAAARTALGVVNSIYPVGSIYINATNATNPATLLGVGTWVAFGAGRVPVGFNAGDPLFDAAEKTGGSKDAVVVSHSHTGSTSTNGEHNHQQTQTPSGFSGAGTNIIGGSNGGGAMNDASQYTRNAGSHNHTFTTGAAGVSGTNANVQPFITVYMWKRTA
jgi:hypothetical protein